MAIGCAFGPVGGIAGYCLAHSRQMGRGLINRNKIRMTKRINDYILFCFCGCIFVLGIVIALFFPEEYTPMRINAHPIPHWSNVLSTILFSNIIVGISLSVFGILTCGLSICTFCCGMAF